MNNTGIGEIKTLKVTTFTTNIKWSDKQFEKLFLLLNHFFFLSFFFSVGDFCPTFTPELSTLNLCVCADPSDSVTQSAVIGAEVMSERGGGEGGREEKRWRL